MWSHTTESSPLGRYARMIPPLLVGNTLIAALLALSGVGGSFLRLWFFCQAVGWTIGTSIFLIHLAMRSHQHWLAVLIGTALAILLIKGAATLFGSAVFLFANQDMALRILGIALIFTLAFTYFFHSQARLKSLETARKEAELQRVHHENLALVANLQMLQAQIEPHFLFNTLANLHSLIESDPPRAKTLLERLNTYLRASLDHSRSMGRTLGDECDLLGAYLDIQALRMGGRFSWSLQVPEELRTIPLPPMLLQPLVENAIRHGIEPKVGPGRIGISASLAEGLLRLTVCDDGLGFSDGGPGQGVGLGNVRDRLKAIYGTMAGMQIRSGTMEHQKGVLAELWIPVPPAP